MKQNIIKAKHHKASWSITFFLGRRLGKRLQRRRTIHGLAANVVPGATPMPRFSLT